MIRALALVVALLAGLGAAMVLGGRVAHLRAVWGAALPGWTTGLDAEAGVVSGHGQLAGGALRWQLAGVDGEGARWRVTLSGADWQVRGVAHWRGGAVRITALAWLVPGGWIAGVEQGTLAVSGGTLVVQLWDGRLVTGRIEGVARDLMRNGQAISGPVVVTWQDGAWRLPG